jgi:molybdenum cofactor cytidylyltransferase
VIGAIILAAGKSERMGGKPKALLRYDGLTFLDHILRSMEGTRIQHRVVVAGLHHSEIKAHSKSVPVVFNPDYEQGMTTSFQAGIRSLPEGIEGALIFLVDHPAVSGATVRALLAHQGEGDVVVPVREGRRGHPVLFSRRFLDAVLKLSPRVGVNTAVRRLGGKLVEVAVDDPGILTDVDTPEDFRRLVSSEK